MIKTIATLYKQSKKDATQSWEIQVEGNKFRTIAGQIGGKLTIGSWTICEGKNIGRANETSPVEQALAEAEAKATKKRDGGYDDNATIKNVAKFFEPMLAHKWDDCSAKIIFPFAVNPKYDGMRCITTKDGMFSRNGKPIVSAPHIFHMLNKFFEKYPNIILDGELYNHELKYNFNKIISLVKKTKPTLEDLVESEKLIEYHCYDMFDTTKPDLTYEEREQFIRNSLFGGTYLHKVPSVIANNIGEANKLHEQFLAAGYEGSIIRKLDGVYENKRSKNLLKRKDFQDEEFEILDIQEGIGARTGTAGNMIFKNKDGKEFSSNIKGDFKYLADILKNKKKLIGKMATVKYFSLTPDNTPRFPFVTQINREEFE